MHQGQGGEPHEPSIDPSDPVEAGLALMREGLELVLSARGWSMSDRGLLASVVDLASLRSLGEAAHLHLLRMVEERESARSTGAPSTAAWLRVALRLSPGRAKADVDAAQLADPDGGPLAALGTALGAGQISREHVDIGVRTLGKVPMHLRERTVAAAELAEIASTGTPGPAERPDDVASGAGVTGVTGVVAGWLLRQSLAHHPVDVARLSRHVLAVADPTGQERFDARAFERRYLRLGVDATGMTFGTFQLDQSAGVVKTMLDFLSAPDAGQVVDSDGNVDRSPDTRKPEQRRADAFVEMARLAAASVTGERTRAAEPPLVLVHASAEQLTAAFEPGSSGTSPGLATSEQTGPLPPWALRRLTCDANVQVVAMSSAGAPLWLGRTRRFASREQRRALAARDRGCAHPGCQRPTSWCEVHHAPGWRRGSPTDIDAMVLLCSVHHTLCDLGIWVVEFVDGIPWFVPPRWVDPAQRRLRNHWPDDVDRAHRLGQLLRDALGPGP